MTCQELERLLYPYLDGEFGPDERLRRGGAPPACAELRARGPQEDPRCASAARAARARRPAQPGAGLAARRHPGGPAPGAAPRLARPRGCELSAAAAVRGVAGGAWLALTRPAGASASVEDAASATPSALPCEIASATPEQRGGVVRRQAGSPRRRCRSFPNAQRRRARGISNVHGPPGRVHQLRDDAGSGGAPGRRVGLFVFDDAEREVEARALPDLQVEARAAATTSPSGATARSSTSWSRIWTRRTSASWCSEQVSTARMINAPRPADRHAADPPGGRVRRALTHAALRPRRREGRAHPARIGWPLRDPAGHRTGRRLTVPETPIASRDRIFAEPPLPRGLTRAALVLPGPAAFHVQENPDRRKRHRPLRAPCARPWRPRASRCEETTDGKGSVEQIRRERPDLVVLAVDLSAARTATSSAAS